MIDLRPDLLEVVREILGRLVPVYEVRAFGSRQKWTAKEASDLDLAVVAPTRLPIKTMAAIKEAFQDSILPMRVDVLDWHAISPEFQSVIEESSEVIQGGEATPLAPASSPAAVGSAATPLSGAASRNAPEIHFALSELSFPASWAVEPLCKCLEDESVSYGIVQPGTHDIHGIPILRVNNFQNTTLNISDVMRVSPSIEAKYSRTRLQGGEVLMTIVGSIGQVTIVPPSLAGWNVARAVCVLRPKSEIGSGWLSLWLRSPFAQRVLGIGANTTVQTTVNLKDIKALPILLPPKNVRNAIAHILGTIDDRIELCRRMNETLEAMARALFKDWFIDFGPVRAKMEGREPPGLSPEIAALFPDKLVDSELGEIPEGWNVRTIYEATSVIYGAPFASKQFNTNGIGMPLVRIRDLKNEAPGVYTDEVHPKGYLIQAGDIVAGMDGEFRAYVWGGESAWLNQRVCVFKPNANVPSPFVRESIIPLLLAVEDSETATTVIHLGKNDIDRFLIRMPPNEILKVFGDAANGIYDQIVGLKYEARTLATLRDALLPKLLSGELSVADFDVEQGIHL